jgi:hypothetical protein
MIVNWLAHPFLIIFNPTELWRQFKIMRVKKNPRKFTQGVANGIYEPVQPEFAEWTADAASSVYSCLFFLPILPIGLPIGTLN